MRRMWQRRVAGAAAVLCAAGIVVSACGAPALGDEPAAAGGAKPASAPAARHPLDTLALRHWCEVPDSHLMKVAFTWPRGVVFSLNGIGPKGVISLWSSGAYDTKRDRLIIWGGGHKGYAGNEVYVFDVKALAWQRITDPCLQTDREGTLERAGHYADGTPRSSHTYNYIQYVPAIDRFCAFGTSGQWPSGQTGSAFTWTFDFDTKKWGKKANTPAHGIGAYSAVDPVTGHAFCRGNGRGCCLAEWDPLKDLWTDRTGSGLNNKTDYAKTAAIDPIGRRFIGIGGGEVYKYEIGRPGKVTQDVIKTTGPQEAVTAHDPGLEYDPVLDRFVAWRGGPEVYALDLEGLAWEKVAPVPDNAVVPTKPNGNGTYGRFRYIPSRNAYVLVNSAQENVFLYRLSDLAAQPVPKRFKAALMTGDAALVMYVAGQVARFSRKEAEPVLKTALAARRADAAVSAAIEEALKDLGPATD